MRWWDECRFRFARLLKRREAEADLEDEIRSHIEIEVQQNIDSGMRPEEAQWAARLKFGNVTLAHEDSRAQWGWLWVERLWQDLRCAARMFAKSPGFTATAVISLGLGMGATTAAFSLLNVMFFRPLPYPGPDRLVEVLERELGKPEPDSLTGVSMPTYRDWKAQSRSFESLAQVWDGIPFVLNQRDRSVEVLGGFVTPEYFPMLGARACRGRLLAPEDYLPGRKTAVVLSHASWQRLFGLNPSVVGTSLRLEGKPHEVVGVMCPEFPTFWGEKVDLWIALNWQVENRALRNLSVIGRMKPGTSIRAVQAEMDVIASRLAKQYPQQEGFGVRVQPLRTYLYGDYQKRFLAFFAAMVLVLLIASTNVANLLLARGAGREKEMAVRASLGAGRPRLMRQLLTESALLSCLGMALGLLVAHAGVRLGVRFSPEGANVATGGVSLDWRVLGFAALLAFLTGWLFGWFPALRVSRPNLNESLKEAGRRPVAGHGFWRTQTVLVIAQTAFSLVLLAGAGLMIHNVWRQLRVTVGCNTERVLQIYTQLTRSEYMEKAGKLNRMTPKAGLTIQAIEARIKAIPGVIGVGLGGSGALGGCYSRPISAGGPLVSRDRAQRSCYDPVSPAYFGMLDIPVLKGRVFSESDSKQSSPVAVINESFAKRYFPREDPVGKTVDVGLWDDTDVERREIVGVVGDVRQRPWAAAAPALYYPYSQLPPEFRFGISYEHLMVTFVVRTATDPARMAPVVGRVLREVAPDILVSWNVTMNDIRWWSTEQPRFYGWVLAIFAATALVLVAVGVFGVTSYTVSQRTHEIGIRMALGAHPLHVLRLILRNGVPQILIGLAIGLGGTLALARFLEARFADLRLEEVKPTDPGTLAVVCLLVAVVAALASLIPARRAARTDPMAALRCA